MTPMFRLRTAPAGAPLCLLVSGDPDTPNSDGPPTGNVVVITDPGHDRAWPGGLGTPAMPLDGDTMFPEPQDPGWTWRGTRVEFEAHFEPVMPPTQL